MALINEYHRARGLTRSAIVRLLQSPAHYKAWLEERKTTSDMRVGTLFHYMCLTPDRIKGEIAIHKDTKTLESRSGRAFIEQNRSRFCCTKAEWDEARELFQAIRANKDAWDMIRLPAKRERLVKVRINGIECKALIDLSARNFIMDLKTTGDDLGKFERSILKWGLDIQGAWYQRLAEAVDGIRRPFIFLPVEKKKPHGCYPIQLDQEWLDYGWQRCLKAINIYKSCLALDEWPGYPFGVRTAKPPRWLLEEAKLDKALPDLQTALEIEAAV